MNPSFRYSPARSDHREPLGRHLDLDHEHPRGRNQPPAIVLDADVALLALIGQRGARHLEGVILIAFELRALLRQKPPEFDDLHASMQPHSDPAGGIDGEPAAAAGAGIVAAVMSAPIGEILPGLWRFAAVHPEWSEDEGGADGWDQVVAWWATSTTRGLLLIDPLVSDWDELDRMIGEHRGCAGVVRTIHWHQRSVAEAADRYGASVWARRAPSGEESRPLDQALEDGDELGDGIQALSVERADEIALWLPAPAALLFGDAMLRRDSGQLHVCPDSWSQPEDGPTRLRAVLGGLASLPVEHVLVSHGPLVLGSGLESLQAAVR